MNKYFLFFVQNLILAKSDQFCKTFRIWWNCTFWRNDSLPKFWGPAYTAALTAKEGLSWAKCRRWKNPIDFCFFHRIHLDGVRKMELTLYPSPGVWFSSTEPLQMSLVPWGFKSVWQDMDRSGTCPGKRLSTCLTETMPLVPLQAAQPRQLNGTFLQRLVLGSTSGEHIRPCELLHSVQVGLQCSLSWGCL